MPRIKPVTEDSADQGTAELLAGVRKKLGMIPNLISTMAHSRPVTNAYLGLSQALSAGELPARLREQIALAVSEVNACGYCVAAHTVLGQGAGLSEKETLDARRGSSAVAREQAALAFVRRVLKERGSITDADLDAVRRAGYSDGQVNEIIANVALTIFTNYFNLVAGTEVDFPAAPALAAA